jgi:hypothetical protein
MRLIPFATRLADHLAASRSQGLSFDLAWKRATTDEKPEPDAFDWPIEFTRRVMRQGYGRVQIGSRGGSNMPALMERDRIYKDPALRAEIAIERRCGWGGDPCKAEARDGGWLCAEHSAILHALPMPCQAPRCYRDAPVGEQYCPRHVDRYTASNLAGSRHRHAKRAA